MSEGPPLGRVLVATDFSGAAMRAVERSARLPLGPGSTLTVLHVLRPGCSREDRADAERQLRYAASLAADVATRVGRKDVDVVTRMAEGTPFVEIVRGGRDARSELVVVGRHGERTFRDLLLGSTAERVIRAGDAPILVVGWHPAAPYERPLVAVDCSDNSRHALELAGRVVDAGAQGLEVVYAYETIPESALRRAGIVGELATRYHVDAKGRAQAAVDSFLSHVPRPANVVVREGDARRVILDVAAQHDSDLLALGTHGRSGLTHALLGSIAEAVIRAATCDVLVARGAEVRFELP